MIALGDYQVIVVGGGPGGIMAALASSRMGAKTLLVERGAFLGGSATRSLIGPISPFHFGDERVVFGLPAEFVDRLVEAGGATGHMKSLNPMGTGCYVCLYDHDVYKFVAQSMLVESGCDLLFHAEVHDVEMDGSRIEGLVLTSKYGTYHVRADVVVDATGDGDVAVLAGEAFTYGDGAGKAQPSSLMFQMSGVDTERVYDYVLDHLDEFGRLSDLVAFRDSPYAGNRYFIAQGFQSLVDSGIASGELVFGRSNIHVMTGLHPGTMHFNSTRISNYDTESLLARSASEIDGRNQVDSIARFMIGHVPGFESAYVSGTGIEVGVRESRHIAGQYTITRQDLIESRTFGDVIARGLFPVDIHGAAPVGAPAGAPEGAGGLWIELPDAFDVPYRVLVPRHVDGLVLAGRCISADSVAFSSLRVQGSLMSYSQASGVAAALCASLGTSPRALDARLVRDGLAQLGADPMRDERRKEEDERLARNRVRDFLASHDKIITPKRFYEPYL